MSRAEEKPLWAGRERSQLNEVRNKKSLEDCIRRVEETLGRLDILKKELAQVSIELRADMSRLVAAVDKGAAQQEQSSQSLRTSREARDNETKAVRTEMERRVGEKKGENHNAPDNRGVESEGFILSKELPRLSSAAGGIPARRELTNGTGAVANRPEETSDKWSGLKCHDIETAKTPEVQPKLEPTNQRELQEVRQVGMEIVPSKPPLPPRFYEPPSRGCWEQPTGESSRGHKRPFQGQPDRFSEQQTTATGQVFHQPDKGPIMRVSDSNRTPTEISRDLQSVSQRPSIYLAEIQSIRPQLRPLGQSKTTMLIPHI
ncbi:hypothetical protein FGLOB1_10793 [Fusarium globosum]|uniref:Uncharacterized protein n=1 Tax=Fusarium globosum TaxID=78864 RepID=A0A8H5XUE9_9HYPO|nr:hypothetical protein FGLOB1_10793 [Fusarium globosum]